MKELVKIIADELVKYERQNKIVDEKFIRNIVDMFIHYYKIEDFVASCDFKSDLGKDYYSGYNIAEKKIYFGYDKEIKGGTDQIKINGLYFNNESKIQFINYRLIGAIIHELTHALQYYKCFNNGDDLETFLLNYCLGKNITLLKYNQKTDGMSDDMLYYFLAVEKFEDEDMYYLTSPSERLANNCANGYEMEISKCFNSEKYQKLNDVIRLKNLIHSTNTYDQCIPSVYFISIIENIKKTLNQPIMFDNYEDVERFFNNLSKKHNLNLNTRLYYGLPISDNELSSVNQEIVTLQRKVIY